MPAARSALLLVLLAGLCGLASLVIGDEKKNQPQPGKAPTTRNPGKQARPEVRAPARDFEAAVRGSARRFVEAFNRHDAGAVAGGFTSGAEFIAEDGTAVHGRDALERHFARVFADSPQATIELKIESIRALAAGAALEEGLVLLKRLPGDEPLVSRYLAVHVYDGDGWRVAIARDSRTTESSDDRERLRELSWLVGDWMDESEGAVIHTSCRTVPGGQLLQDFTIRRPGEPATKGSTRIAWDPQVGQIRSWTFDSLGGRSEALWGRVPQGDTWLLKTQGVSSAGSIFSATSVLRKIDADTLTWESRDRVERGLLLPDWGPVTVKRRPPAPGE